MPQSYQDPNGCSWTEHNDGEGYVFYFNESTQESAWELPPSCTAVRTEEAGSPTAPVPAFGDDAPPSCWIEILDESTNQTYFYNTTTRESRWELDADDRVTSGLDNVVVGNNAHVEWETYGSNDLIPNEVVSLTAWKDEILNSFQVPPTVSEVISNAGSAQIWPLRMVDSRPSRLERWDVLKAACPNREHFTSSSAGETWCQHHPEFEPKLCFYAFDAAVEHVERYWVEGSEAPFRSRLQRDKLRFSRDMSTWEKKASTRGTTSAVITRDEEDHDRREDNDATFFAFPLMVHNSKAHHVDWTSGPDRYQVTREGEPEWGWMRIFTFYAYAASKYHVLETTESPMAQKVVKGNFLKPERGWKCVLAFYAFDDNVPGSNSYTVLLDIQFVLCGEAFFGMAQERPRYFVEEKDEPYLRTRIGMAPSCRWEARYDFAAFDIGVPGSCALYVHYSVRGTNSLNAQPEQCRISLQDPRGIWAHKFRFYAYPASNVLLAPLDEDVDAASASLADSRCSVLD